MSRPFWRRSGTWRPKGFGVLALARKVLPPDSRIMRTNACLGMDFLGLQGMIDPPRDEAVKAVAACQKAGVSVKMITGDHALTAEAIGLKLGLSGGDCTLGRDCPVLTGREITELSDKELIEKVGGVPVFARVSPEQKLRLVMALQARGEICAMTGDGVNDAPALKQADIGIAMGITGTDVAKDAADMVLTDDNFATITAAVEEGRGVYANLIKFIAWTLPTNAGEGLVILFAILFQTALPILPGADIVDQHDHSGLPGHDARLRAQGAGHHGPSAAQAGQAHPGPGHSEANRACQPVAARLRL